MTTASLATFKRALIAQLRAQQAYFSLGRLRASGARFDGVRVVRCNVDFGDPHVAGVLLGVPRRAPA